MFHQVKIQMIAFSLLLVVSIMSTASADVGQLSNTQLKQLMADNVPIIDIRTAPEWKSTGVIEGSHLLTFFDARGKYDMDKWLSELDKIVKKDEKFVLICRSGNRTGQVTNFLDKKLGYQQVNHLQRGIKIWIRSGDKVIFEK